MPSSVGHALAGLATAWTADLVPRSRTAPAPSSASLYRRAGGGLAVASVVLAAIPDIDLVWHVHRTFTHSVTAALIVGAVAAVVARGRTLPIRRVAVVCACAYATHLLLDWMAADTLPPYGIELLWPFSNRFFISGWDVFLQTERRHFFSVATIETNLRTIAVEVAILLPIVVAVWLVRERRMRSRLDPQVRP